jgi:PAS domain S-box-containing protein
MVDRGDSFPRDLIAMVDGAMVLDTQGRIVAFSEGAERITGYISSEVVGECCADVFESDRCGVACPARRTTESGAVLSNCRCIVHRRDRDQIEISVSTSPLRGADGRIVGAVVVFRNLNEMMEMAIRLTALSREMIIQKERSEAIIDSIADGVMTLDRDMTITSFNRSAERITGYRADEVTGKLCRSVLRSKGCDESCPVRPLLSGGEPLAGVEMDILSSDGRRIPVSITAAPLHDESGQIIGAVETFRDLSGLRRLTEELRARYSFRNLVGKSHRMQDIYRLIETVAPGNTTVLVQGETGTGKDLVARAIHYESPRADRPFMMVNCAALPESLLESELFGHVRGAFTGAIADRKGRFEAAQDGTLFLDEISEVSSAIQAKLLRVLETKEFERVGDSRTIAVDVRLICATNRDLQAAVAEGRFREDLYYRINIVPIVLPPLRERDEDIPLLVDHFIAKLNRETGKQIQGVSPDAMDILIDHSWPGNVRQLENAIGHAFVHCRGEVIQREHLPREVIRAETPRTPESTAFRGTLEDMEKAAIARTLERTGGNRTLSARRLGIGRSSLWRKIKKYGLDG